MKDYLSVLEKTRLFKNIEPSDLEKLINCLRGEVRKYESGTCIIALEQEVNHIGIVLEGQVEVVKENIAGDRNIIAMLEKSGMFAEGIVCTQKRLSPVTVRAKTKADVLMIPYEKIIITCGESCNFHSLLIHNMLMLLGEKNYALNHKIDFLILKGMREKLALYLLEEAKRNKSVAFNITLSRNDLAEYLNVSRSAMSRELSRMKEDGLIDYYKNSFKIINEEALKGFLR
ncbi:MAG: Crp/Fnr family transcriptional regulator [Candidatus Niameybacter stercoravium]|nr:Crp/Fnr family transcriptional regulator [Candidatus Niameybacter stercoravium]